MAEQIKKIHIGPAKCAVDLGDGSERGEYVNQDYILHTLGRPHRAINLMYCYYPLDKEWPGRISEVMKNADVSFQWDYPYDDYFPYLGGLNGNTEGEPFTFMRDVRRHGQDVCLTLTIDPNVSDEHLIAIAKDLRPFGRVMMRINHEATGNWFSFTKRTSYQGVADFYVRFHKIIKEYAPNVSTVLCAGTYDERTGRIEMEDEFKEAFLATDYWSIDKYISLHWGWPFDIAERGGNSHSRAYPDDVFESARKTFDRLKEVNGGAGKPMVMSELNADGDVVGPYDQAEIITEFCNLVKNEKADWLNGFTLYQFRDRGRLGLEIEDPNNPDVGIPQPEMAAYKEIIHDEYFYPTITEEAEVQFPVKMRWGGFEDSDGIEIPLHFDCNPTFCEITFEEELNLMMEINGKWFYKSPKAKTIDFMSAFYEKPLKGECDLTLKIFAPPASGENDPSQGEDWDINYYSEITKMPNIRIRFEPTELKAK
ncbi:MAG: hypothetical protein HDT44_04195 [Ruminococcaceae bacterium]|nr:hypothetical protein [Oscillospiraceae bacterium]